MKFRIQHIQFLVHVVCAVNAFIFLLWDLVTTLHHTLMFFYCSSNGDSSSCHYSLHHYTLNWPKKNNKLYKTENCIPPKWNKQSNEAEDDLASIVVPIINVCPLVKIVLCVPDRSTVFFYCSQINENIQRTDPRKKSIKDGYSLSLNAYSEERKMASIVRLLAYVTQHTHTHIQNINTKKIVGSSGRPEPAMTSWQVAAILRYSGSVWILESQRISNNIRHWDCTFQNLRRFCNYQNHLYEPIEFHGWDFVCYFCMTKISASNERLAFSKICIQTSTFRTNTTTRHSIPACLIHASTLQIHIK